MQRKKFPVGIEDFEEICKERFYYIDKTGLIRKLLNSRGKVNLFTRPHRFGKTLNMNMLKCFFEIGTDKTLFDELTISQEPVLYEEHMGKYPVIFIPLKGVDGLTYELAIERFKTIIQEEALRLHGLLQDEFLSSFDRKKSGK